MPPMPPLVPRPTSPQPRRFPEIVDLDEDSSHQEEGRQELTMDFLQDIVGFRNVMRQHVRATRERPQGIMEIFLAEMGAST